jgi:nucleoid DNA-binding protein
MTKVDIVNRLSGNVGLPRNEAQEIVEVIFGTLKETVVAGESVKVARFGTFMINKTLYPL